MRVLATGNHGYIGTAMVRMLQANRFDVAGLDSARIDETRRRVGT